VQAFARRCSRSFRHGTALAVLFGLAGGACSGNPVPDASGATAVAAGKPADARASEAGQAITPPFAVQGELDGLLLVWFDDKGLHSARHRSEIPEPQRARVRVDSLAVPPSQRLDPDYVYVADVRAPAAGGGYAVRKYTRGWFDAQVDAARPQAQAAADDSALSNAGVTIYKASWCGVCKSAAAYLRSRNVAFVEKDIEKDAAAASEMQQKARAAGQNPRGVPVIDFHGHLLMGFDQATLDRLIAQYNG
jgi:glutaredoxin